MNKKEITNIIEIAFVLTVTFAMFAYGIGKYIQFDNPKLLTKAVNELTGMELMWAFYGYSKNYAILLGMAEITGGMLFLIRKTRLLGGLLLTGILLNVIIQDIVFGVHVGALKAAIMYQLMIFSVFWIHRETLIEGLKMMIINKPNEATSNTRKIAIILIAIVLAVLLKVVELKMF